MTIRTKLIISTCIQLALVGGVTVVLAIVLQATHRATARTERGTSINQAITEMRFITFENLLNRSDRSLEQWQAKYQTLNRILAPVWLDGPAERAILTTMVTQHQAVKTLFDRLETSYQEPMTTSDPKDVASFRERLAGQLLVKQQAQITEAGQLIALNQTALATQQIGFFWLVLGAIVLMLLVTAINARLVTTTISRALGVLQQGAATIAAGDLGYRIPYPRADEFGRLAKAFNSMAASLQQIDRTKSEFILMVSHQLRTPATAVKGFMALLLDGYMGKLGIRQTEALRAAFAENERQLGLIDEMLVVAQAETSEMILSHLPTDLDKLVNDIATAQAVVLKSKSQTVTVHCPKRLPKVPVDPDKLRIVIENLLTNASNYSPEHKHISITVQTSDVEATIAVADNGIGITKADQGKIFQKFSRIAQAGETRIEGAGLGLYLAKKIMMLHHGRITLVSEAGKGSTFTLHLPLV